MKWSPNNFNDFLALILIFLIPAFWVLQGCSLITVQTEVNGGLLVSWTIILQYYFRRSPPTSGEATP